MKKTIISILLLTFTSISAPAAGQIETYKFHAYTCEGEKLTLKVFVKSEDLSNGTENSLKYINTEIDVLAEDGSLATLSATAKISPNGLELKKYLTRALWDKKGFKINLKYPPFDIENMNASRDPLPVTITAYDGSKLVCNIEPLYLSLLGMWSNSLEE